MIPPLADGVAGVRASDAAEQNVATARVSIAARNFHYARRKAEAKRAVKERAAWMASLQARIMADPALVQHLMAIKEQLASDETELLMNAVAGSTEVEQTKFLDEIKALSIEAAVAFCREVIGLIREHAAASK